MIRSALRSIGGFLLMTPLLTGAGTSALAQGCSEQLAQDFLAGWSHNMSKLLSIFSDNLLYEDTTVHAVLHNKEELRGFAEGWFKAFPDLSFSTVSVVTSGNRGAVVWRVTGTQRGDMPGMPASNKAVDQLGVSIMECADGKITHLQDFYDMATTMRQLGFLKAGEQ